MPYAHVNPSATNLVLYLSTNGSGLYLEHIPICIPLHAFLLGDLSTPMSHSYQVRTDECMRSDNTCEVNAQYAGDRQ